jgi:hypothetical protein
MVTVGDGIHGQDLIGQRGTPRSNCDRWLKIGRWQRLLLQLYSMGETEEGRRHGRRLVRAQARATGHQMRSRTQGEPVLQTYGEGNSRGRVSDGGVVRSALADIKDGLRWFSGFEEQLYSFALLCSRSSLGQFLLTSMNQAHAAAIFVR